MNDICYGIILGIVQGITEFLPISSSAHLILVSSLIKDKPLPIALNVALHIGTLAAILWYFRRDWIALAQASIRFAKTRRKSFETHILIPALLVGTVPAGIIGKLWEHDIEAYFHHPQMVAIPLFVVGILMWLVDRRSYGTRLLVDLQWTDGLIVGLAQACALVPGVSRSGSTILAGRARGMDRATAARFSFLLGMPITAGAVLLKSGEIIRSLDQPIFYVGAIVSCVSGCFAIGFLLNFFRKFGLFSFMIYRCVIAIIISLSIYYW